LNFQKKHSVSQGARAIEKMNNYMVLAKNPYGNSLSSGQPKLQRIEKNILSGSDSLIAVPLPITNRRLEDERYC
jgi:hypothetical protein